MSFHRVVVASNNPVKLESTKKAFKKLFKGDQFSFLAVAAPSGVGNQPVGDQETLLGATNRAEYIQEKIPKADFWVGLEGGVEFGKENDMSAFAWIVIKNGKMAGKARTGTFFLPPEIGRLVRSGKELGEADDIVFNQLNSKQKNGAIGLLSDNVLTRTDLYEQAVLLALIPFKNISLFT